MELYAQVVDEGRRRTLTKQIGDNSPRIRAEPLCHLFCRENFLRFHIQDKHNVSFVIISNLKEKRNLPFHAAKIIINERETSNLFEYFSQRVQVSSRSTSMIGETNITNIFIFDRSDLQTRTADVFIRRN